MLAKSSGSIANFLLPRPSTMSLSIPRGPKVVLTVSTTALQAFMLDNSCPLPCEVSVPSLRRMICGCYMSQVSRSNLSTWQRSGGKVPFICRFKAWTADGKGASSRTDRSICRVSCKRRNGGQKKSRRRILVTRNSIGRNYASRSLYNVKSSSPSLDVPSWRERDELFDSWVGPAKIFWNARTRTCKEL